MLTPHRSLGHVGFLVLMIVFGGVSFFTGIAFLLMGAWPVFGFFGLDVLLLYWAFRLNYRACRRLRGGHGDARRAHGAQGQPGGAAREWVLNPLWVKLDKVVHEEYGVERLFLVSRGKRLTVGNFLGPDEKASFARRSAKP